MPARTNEFQKLIVTINRHLAPTDAKVTESAMLFDAEAEINREIDILVESKMMNCDIRIGIECTALKRKVDIKTIESIKEKHKNVGIHKSIIVSKMGYSDAAKRYAKKHDVKLLTFNSAEATDWSKAYERLKGLHIYGRTYTIAEITLGVAAPDHNKNFSLSNTIEVMVDGNWTPLEKFAGKLFIDSNISAIQSKELMANEMRGKNPFLVIGFELGGAYLFKNSSGDTITPLSIEIVYNYKSKYKPLNTRQVAYDGEALVVGGFSENSEDFAHIAITESDGDIVGTIEIGNKFLPGDN